MASSLLSLASNHLADWGTTLTGDREQEERQKGGKNGEGHERVTEIRAEEEVSQRGHSYMNTQWT